MSVKRRWLSSGVAIALTVIALLLSLSLENLTARTIGAFFYIAIAVSTRYGGKMAGFTAIILSLVLIDYFILPPLHQIQIANFNEVLQLSLIATVGIMINLLVTSRQESQEAEAAQRQLQQEQASHAIAENYRLEQILQQLPIGVAIAEAPTGKLLYHNDEAIRLLRHPLIKSGTYQDYAQYGAVHPDGQPYQPEEYPLARALLSGEIIQAEEMHYRRRDGTETMFSVSAVPILDPHGQRVASVSTFEDISDRKQVEHAVAKELLRVQTLFNTTLDGIVIVDEQGRVLEANPRFAEMLGYTLPEVATLSIFDWDAQFTPEVIQQLLQNSLIQRDGIFETQHRRRDGSIYDVEISYNVVEWDGNILRFCSCRDISERKRIEAERYQWQLALQEQEASYRQLFENNPQPMWVFDLETLQFLAVNPAAIVKYGYSEAEFLAMTIADIRPPQDIPRLLEHVRQVTEGLDDAGIWQHQLKDGSVITVEIIAHTLEFSGQRAKLVLANDITERKLAEEALQRSESRFRQMAMAAPCVIFTWVFHPGQEARFEYLNPYFERLHEIPIAEAFADYNVVNEQIHPDDRDHYRQVVAHCVERLQPFQHEWRIITPSGKVKWLYASAELEVRENGEVAWHGVGLDLSDRKQAELALQKLNQSLEQKVEARTAELCAREAQLRAIVEAIPDLLLHVTRDGTYLASERLQQHVDDGHGTQPALLDVLPPDLLDQKLDRIKRAIATGILQVYEHHFLRDSNSVYEEVRIARINSNEALVIVRDISDRKTAERSLQESQQLLQSVLDATPIPIFWKDRQSVYQGVNAVAAQNLGLASPSDCVGLTDAQLPWLPEDALAFQQEDLQVMESGQSVFNQPYHLWLQDGTELWFEISKVPLRNASGHVIGVLGTAPDITERKRTELALRKSEEELRLFINASSDVVYKMSADWQEIRQLDSKECLVNTSDSSQLWFETCIPPAEHPRLWSAIQAAIQTKSPFELEHQVIQRDGSIGWSFSRSIPMLDEQGEIMEWFGTASDISDRKRVESQLQASQAYFQSIVADQTELICRFLPNGTLTFVNNAYCQFFQKSPEQLIGQSFTPLLPEEDQDIPATHFSRLSVDHPVVTYEHRVIAPDGSMHWQQWTDRAFFAPDGTPIEFQAVGHDITVLKEAEARLRYSNQELQRATRLKDEFLANMSHELRTPLNAILGMSEGLQDGILGEINQQQLEALQVIEHSGSHLLSLINDILDLARIESGQSELSWAPTNIQTLCHSSLEFVKQQALKKQIQLELQCPSNLPELVMDERRILQVLVNLLNNAVKFTPNGGHVTLAVSLPVLQTEEEARQWLRLTVQDTGIGIEPEYIPKLFQSFVQVDSALNRQYEGTGLGLALAKRIVEQHGGQVGLTSALGVGSCFTIDLPYITVQPSTAESSLQINPNLNLDQSAPPIAPLILLAEDNETNIFMITNYLQFKGHRLLVARDGQAAIALTQTEHPDLILMDIQMPGMDGIEAIQQIRRLPECGSIPIIALTALAMAGDRDLCLAAGANDYLSKPVPLKQLVAKIQQFLFPYQPE